MDDAAAVDLIRQSAIEQLTELFDQASGDHLRALHRAAFDLASVDALLKLLRRARAEGRPSARTSTTAAWHRGPANCTCPRVGGISRWADPPGFVLSCASEFMHFRDTCVSEGVCRKWWRALREGGQRSVRYRLTELDAKRFTLDSFLSNLERRRSSRYLARVRCLALTSTKMATQCVSLLPLRSMTGLERLAIHSTSSDLTLADGDSLMRLGRIRHLSFDGCSLTDHDLASIGSLTTLRHLDLMDVGLDSRVTAAGFKRLEPLRDLEELWLNETDLDGEMCAVVGSFLRLVRLSLHSCFHVAQNLAHLAQCSGLETLWLSDVALTNGHLGALAPLQQLQHLYLNENPGLSDLADFPPLRRLCKLDLEATGVDCASVARLGALLPELTDLDVANCPNLHPPSPDWATSYFARLERMTIETEKIPPRA